MTITKDIQAAEDAWTATVERFLNSRVRNKQNALTTLAAHFATHREATIRETEEKQHAELKSVAKHFGLET